MGVLVTPLVIGLLLFVGACTNDDGTPNGTPDPLLPASFSAIIGNTIGSESAPVLGTDGRYHVVYELMLTNARQVPATIETFEVLDLDNLDRVVARFTGEELAVAQLSVRPRSLEGDGSPLAGDPLLEPNESLLAFIELTFATRADVPARLVHRLTGTGAANPGSTEPQPVEYLMTPFELSRRTTPVVSAPLQGDGWAVLNGCCSAGVHRSAVQTIGGSLVAAQRFAIDWVRIGDNGRFFAGDPADAANWYAYGAPVLAVADGTVVSVLDGLPDQVPGVMPDRSSVTLETVDGNHVILDLGNGVYAFYAHLRRGSITVAQGDQVRGGEQLGELGNSGNSSAPHLHFHLMNGPSALGADGVPVTFDGFTLMGVMNQQQWAQADASLDEVWTLGTPDPASTGRAELPLDLSVVDFSPIE